MLKEVVLPPKIHVNISATAEVPNGDSIEIQNISAEEVWIYYAQTAQTEPQGRLLRRGDVYITDRGAPGVYGVCTRGEGILTTSKVSEFKTFTVDNEPIALKEGRQFRIVRKISVTEGDPIVWKFSAFTDFQLVEQQLSTSVGDIELTVHRAANVSELTAFNTPVLTFGKNITDQRRLYNGSFYTRKNQVNTGGTISIIDPEQYADYDRSKTSNATAQQLSVDGSENSLRNLAGDQNQSIDYYIELKSLSGTSIGRYALAWTEFI